MNRRTFLEISCLGALGALARCASSTTRASDAGATSGDAAPMGDALMQRPDTGNLATDAESAAFVVGAFAIFLNDPSCSGHDHGCGVEASAYADDSPVSFLGGSHLVQFRPSELVRLERGEQLPCATSGAGPGHGHCGLAWRDGLFSPSRDRVDACEILPPGSGPMAICEARPRP